MKASPGPAPQGSVDPAYDDGEGGPDPSAEPAGAPGEPRRARGPLSRLPRWLKLGALALLIGGAVAATWAYRRHQERRIVALSLARAEQLVRSDTWVGYHETALLLGIRAAALDPVRAGSLRARALAMLSLDYRDESAGTQAASALVTPERSDELPRDASLAEATLALRQGHAGTALERLSPATGQPDALVLAARVALLAGNPSAAGESIEKALRADPGLPAALALRGDLLRRAGRAREARDAYAAALQESARALKAGLEGSSARPGAVGPHPRATFGLAKLALSREAPVPEAVAALNALVGDAAGTPQVERARAAMHLSALQARLGDRAAATATLDRAGLDGDLRTWLERAAGQLEVTRGAYRVPDATPAVLLSTSDDDAYVPPPPPKAEPPPSPSRRVLHGFKVHPVTRTAPGSAKRADASRAAPRRR